MARSMPWVSGTCCAAAAGLVAAEHLGVGRFSYSPWLSYGRWRQAHVLAQGVFAGVVWGGSAAEVVTYALGRYGDYLRHTRLLDDLVAVPSMALSCLSGMAMVRIRYSGRGEPVPRSLRRSVQLLMAFGAFWAVADRSTQAAKEPEDVFALRCAVNAIECTLVNVLQLLMAGPRRGAERGERKRKGEADGAAAEPAAAGPAAGEPAEDPSSSAAPSQEEKAEGQ